MTQQTRFLIVAIPVQQLPCRALRLYAYGLNDGCTGCGRISLTARHSCQCPRGPLLMSDRAIGERRPGLTAYEERGQKACRDPDDNGDSIALDSNMGSRSACDPTYSPIKRRDSKCRTVARQPPHASGIQVWYPEIRRRSQAQHDGDLPGAAKRAGVTDFCAPYWDLGPPLW